MFLHWVDPLVSHPVMTVCFWVIHVLAKSHVITRSTRLHVTAWHHSDHSDHSSFNWSAPCVHSIGSVSHTYHAFFHHDRITKWTFVDSTLLSRHCDALITQQQPQLQVCKEIHSLVSRKHDHDIRCSRMYFVFGKLSVIMHTISRCLLIRKSLSI